MLDIDKVTNFLIYENTYVINIDLNVRH